MDVEKIFGPGFFSVGRSPSTPPSTAAVALVIYRSKITMSAVIPTVGAAASAPQIVDESNETLEEGVVRQGESSGRSTSGSTSFVVYERLCAVNS